MPKRIRHLRCAHALLQIFRPTNTPLLGKDACYRAGITGPHVIPSLTDLIERGAIKRASQCHNQQRIDTTFLQAAS